MPIRRETKIYTYKKRSYTGKWRSWRDKFSKTTKQQNEIHRLNDLSTRMIKISLSVNDPCKKITSSDKTYEFTKYKRIKGTYMQVEGVYIRRTKSEGKENLYKTNKE